MASSRNRLGGATSPWRRHGFAAPFRGKVYALASPQQIQRAFAGNLASEVKRVPLNDEDLRYEDGTANSLMRRATTLALAAKAGLPRDPEGLIWDPSNSNKHRVEKREWTAMGLSFCRLRQ